MLDHGCMEELADLHHLCSRICRNVKAMIGEFTDDTNQGTAMSYLGVAVGLGCVTAPVLGGSFARPCENFGSGFPFCGPNEFLRIRCVITPLFLRR